jgi:hypothetical protein
LQDSRQTSTQAQTKRKTVTPTPGLYLFLHWRGGSQRLLRDWKKHPFIRIDQTWKQQIHRLLDGDKVIITRPSHATSQACWPTKRGLQAPTHPRWQPTPLGKKRRETASPTPAPNQDTPSITRVPIQAFPTTRSWLTVLEHTSHPTGTGWRKCAAKDMPMDTPCSTCQEV